MVVRAGVFVLESSGTLVPMEPSEFAAEVDFQEMLSKFPSLLVGDQINADDPRRFLLIKQELAIGHEADASRWSLDHLFLDQDGIPTLVEVKRKSDSRLRREVVGQMLDYAANFQAFWSADKILSAFELACSRTGADSNSVLAEFLGPETNVERFWGDVATNIRAGKLRLLFVADHIPSELRRIVEFLNEQMSPAEVLALELRQFVGQGLRTIVPVVFGQTQESASRKEPGRGERWTEDRLVAALESKLPENEVRVARAILDWMKGCGFPLAFGTGLANGSVYPLYRQLGIAINPAYLSTDGKLWLQFKSLEGKPVFGELEERLKLVRLFAEVEGSGLSDASVDKYANVPLSAIAADPAGTSRVIAALQWIADQVKSTV